MSTSISPDSHPATPMQSLKKCFFSLLLHLPHDWPSFIHLTWLSLRECAGRGEHYTVGHRCTVIADRYGMVKDGPAFIAVRDSAIAWNCIWSHIVQWYLPVVSSDRFNARTLSHSKHSEVFLVWHTVQQVICKYFWALKMSHCYLKVGHSSTVQI